MIALAESGGDEPRDEPDSGAGHEAMPAQAAAASTADRASARGAPRRSLRIPAAGAARMLTPRDGGEQPELEAFESELGADLDEQRAEQRDRQDDHDRHDEQRGRRERHAPDHHVRPTH